MNAQDLQRIEAGTGWRRDRIEVFRGTSGGDVLVKGQRLSGGAWRVHLLNALAWALRVPMLSGDRQAHGARAQATEVARLRTLAAAGVPVPALLHVAEAYIVLQHVPGRQLATLLQGAQATHWWQRGLDRLSDTHRRGQYLSQAFPRNFIADGETLVAIDFESDPCATMSLDAAMARDWLAYLFSSMLLLPATPDDAAARLRATLLREPPAVPRLLQRAVQRMTWVMRLRGEGEHRSWRRHVSSVQAVVGALAGAGIADGV